MYYFTLLYFLFAFLYKSTNVGAAIELEVVGGSNEQCSDSTVTLQCTLSGDYLVWRTPHGFINFIRGQQQNSHTTEHYQSQSEEINSTHLTSNLIFTYTSLITINCSNNNELNDSITVKTEGPPSAPERPLTSLERIERVNKTFSSVSVVWNIPTTNNVHISSYVVTVDPPISLPGDGVISGDNPLFNSRQLTLTLQHGQQYNIRVRAKSCNDSVDGTTSNPLTINVQVPQPVTRCSAVPVYDYFSNNLNRIEIDWDQSHDVTRENITENITANVQSYIVTLISEEGEPVINRTLSSDTLCVNNYLCHYEYFPASHNVLRGNFSVYVIAKNLLSYGYSEQKDCINATISSKNDVLLVNISRDVLNYFSIYKGARNFSYTVRSTKHEDDGLSVLLTAVTESGDKLLIVETTQRGYSHDTVIEGTIKSEDDRTIPMTTPNLNSPTTTTPEGERTTGDTSCPHVFWILALLAIVTSLPVGFISGVTATIVWRKLYRGKTLKNSFCKF